jgi:hypothetical protein
LLDRLQQRGRERVIERGKADVPARAKLPDLVGCQRGEESDRGRREWRLQVGDRSLLFAQAFSVSGGEIRRRQLPADLLQARLSFRLWEN